MKLYGGTTYGQIVVKNNGAIKSTKMSMFLLFNFHLLSIQVST
jgi:hypothetical protein